MKDKKKNKKIYIVLTFTGTILSRIVRFYTKKEYGHVSLALDKDLKEMYSFGRLNPYNPFIGGFVHEGINKGTFKRFYNTTAAIYSIDVSKDQYSKIKRKIKKMSKKKKQYRFNTLGLFTIPIKLKIKRKNSFYCAEFVKYLTDSAEINLNLPELIKPMDFITEGITTLEYKGLLKNY